MTDFVITITDQALLDGISYARQQLFKPGILAEDQTLIFSTDAAFIADFVNRAAITWAATKVDKDRAVAFALTEKGDFTAIDKLIADAKTAKGVK